jgi:hypothetical protein
MFKSHYDKKNYIFYYTEILTTVSLLTLVNLLLWRWGSSVSRDWGTGVLSPAEAKGFSFSLCVQTSSEAHSDFYPKGTGDHFSEGKAQPGCDADHSPQSNAKVKNE